MEAALAWRDFMVSGYSDGLLQLHREVLAGYCRIVTLSTDNLYESNEFRVSRSIIEPHHGRLWAAPNDDAPGATRLI